MGIPQVGARTSATLASIKKRAVQLSIACEKAKTKKKKEKSQASRKKEGN